MIYKYVTLYLLLLFLLPQGSIAEENTIQYEYRMGQYQRIAQCVASSEKDSFYALTFKHSREGFSKKYQLLYLSKNQVSSVLDLPIPLDTIPNPYLYSDQVRIFKLIEQRFLYIAVQHLDGSVYFCVVDTKKPAAVVRSMKLQPPTGSMLLLDSQGIFTILSKNDLGGFSFLSVDRHGKINQHTKVADGQKVDGILSCAALLNDGSIVASSTYSKEKSIFSSLYVLDYAGNILKKSTMDGIVFQFLAGDDLSFLVLKSQGDENNTTEALVMGRDLTTRQRFTLPSIYSLVDPTSSLTVGPDNSLLLGTIDRKNAKSDQFTLQLFQAGQPKSLMIHEEAKNNSFFIDSFLLKSNRNGLLVAISLIKSNTERSRLHIFKID